MNIKGLLLVALSIVMASAGANAITMTADCEGWSIRGSFTVPADIEYTIDLYQGGVIIWTLTETPSITPDQMFLYSGRWDRELCGDYSVHIDFNYDMGEGWRVISYDTDFTCECEEVGCTYTPGYWKNHPEEWPVTHLTVGCEEYSQSELITIFDMPSKGGDMTIKLFHHLVAAKLNVLLPDADDSIMGAITAGDDFLCTYGFLSAPTGALKTEAENIKDELCAYNEIECEEEEEEEFDAMLSIEGGTELDKASAATEESSWGSIKKRHE